MLCRPEGKVTEVRGQSQKAPSPMLCRPSGKVTRVRGQAKKG